MTRSGMPRDGRAAPLRPEERRSAIVRATVPLLQEWGAAVSTRQIAAAAGVAEGTLFRVFEDKSAILLAAVCDAFEPAPTVARLRALPSDVTLRIRLVAAVDVLLGRGEDLRDLVPVAHELMRGVRPHAHPHAPAAKPAESAESAESAEPGTARHATEHMRAIAHRGPEELTAALVDVLRPYTDELRRSPEICARILFSIVSTGARALFGPDQLTAEQVVEVFLDGMLARPTTPEAPC